jgi:hypothetical protein
MVLTYDVYNETSESQKEKENRLSKMEKQIDSILITLDKLKNQFDIDTVALALYREGQPTVKDIQESSN